MVQVAAPLFGHPACAANQNSPDPRLLLQDFLNGLSLHCFLAVTLDLHGVVGIHFFGLACERHHHYPFLARSVASFWTRWNLVVGSILRAVGERARTRPADASLLRVHGCAVLRGWGSHDACLVAPLAVYEPIAEGKLIAAGSGSDGKLRPWRIWGVDSRDLGATASFLASALMHEWAFWFLTGGIYGGIFSPELRWFWFFILQVCELHSGAMCSRHPFTSATCHRPPLPRRR